MANYVSLQPRRNYFLMRMHRLLPGMHKGLKLIANLDSHDESITSKTLDTLDARRACCKREREQREEGRENHACTHVREIS